MAFIELKIELGRVVEQLTRIADILERYCFPQRSVGDFKPKGPEALFEFDPEKTWQTEQEEEAKGQTEPRR
jgi:hypothetical protein